MNKFMILIVTAMAGVFVYAQQPAATPAAQPAEKPAEVKAGDVPVNVPAIQAIPMTKSGTVQLVRDASGKVIGINLIVTSYKVTMNDVAKQLEAMDGQKVRVKGTISLDGDTRVITIQSLDSAPSTGGASVTGAGGVAATGAAPAPAAGATPTTTK
jgi:hypothetical protein